MYNDFKNIIKEELVRHLIVEQVSLFKKLNEDDLNTGKDAEFDNSNGTSEETFETTIRWFSNLNKSAKKDVIEDINNIFLSQISLDPEVKEYVLKKYINDEKLCLNILLSSIQDKTGVEFLNSFVIKVLSNFLSKKYLNPDGFFGTKALITGNKKLDKLILLTIFNLFEKDLKRGNIKDMPKGFSGIVKNLENNLKKIINNNINKIQIIKLQNSQLNEGIIDSFKIEKLLYSINRLLKLNKETVNIIREVLKNTNADDLQNVLKDGASYTAVLLSIGIMRRTGEVLDKIKLKDPILDNMLRLLSLRLLSENNAYFETLNRKLSDFIDIEIKTKAQKKQQSKNKTNALLSKYNIKR